VSTRTNGRRQRADPDERRKAILDAAAAVVVERGLSDTRVTDVAERVGVSHGLVHYYFPTKDALVTATMRHLAEADILRLRKAIAAEPTAAARLQRLLRVAVPTAATRDGWVLWVDAWSVALRDRAVREVHEELDAAWSQALQEVICEGVANDEFRCADPTRSADRLCALIDGLILRLVLGHKGVTRAYVLESLQQAAEREVRATATATAVRSRGLQAHAG